MLNVGGNNASTTFSGGLSGSGSLTKLGSGILTLSASNGYAGPTIISGGVLKMAAAPMAQLAYTFATGGAVNYGNNASVVTSAAKGTVTFNATGGPITGRPVP